jgi:hypothetical protein
MSRVLKISDGDYRIVVSSPTPSETSPTIILDTGVDVGTVVVTGNLTVKGTTTTINTNEMTIEDRIITLNSGDTGDNGITTVDGNRRSGIEILRGDNTNNYPKAQFLFDEAIEHYDPILNDSISGTFILRTADNSYSGLRLASVGAPPGQDFAVDFGNYNKVLKIVNTDATQYSLLLDATLVDVADTPEDNYIPNKKYVSSYVSATGGTANVDNFHYLSNPTYTRGQAYQTYIKFTVASNERARISTSGLDVDNINLFTNTINNDTNNLILTATTTNTVEVDAVFQLDNQTTDVTTPISGAVQIYTKATEGPGRTGIYFTNDTDYGDNAYNNDELVAKNRALLFSILF